ncbi:putative membrane protein [Neisseria sp. HSC-16F19]|nr:PACE efflux transporter [Neisseria sp. HSC-16F19]MCP2040778.1 putative membrane protein [Neisseria sp. HSC-16F19]
MNLSERLLHAVLFEVGAVAVASSAVLVFSSNTAATAIGASVVMAVMAMVWNFVFNYFFDKVFTGKREQRSLQLRIGHTLAFEAGLLLFTVPVLAYLLQLTLWQALWADIGLTVLITLYALVFNWAYDVLRLRFIQTGA